MNRHPSHYHYPRGNPGLVTRFARKVADSLEVLSYPEVLAKFELPRAEVGLELEAQLLSFMKEAEHIHFQLDGLVARGRGRKLSARQRQSLLDSLELGELGTAIPNNVTNWELVQVFNNFRDKAIFYWKRKPIRLDELLGEDRSRGENP